ASTRGANRWLRLVHKPSIASGWLCPPITHRGMSLRTYALGALPNSMLHLMALTLGFLEGFSLGGLSVYSSWSWPPPALRKALAKTGATGEHAAVRWTGGLVSNLRNPIFRTPRTPKVGHSRKLLSRNQGKQRDAMSYPPYTQLDLGSAEELWAKLSPMNTLFSSPSKLIYRGQANA